MNILPPKGPFIIPTKGPFIYYVSTNLEGCELVQTKGRGVFSTCKCYGPAISMPDFKIKLKLVHMH